MRSVNKVILVGNLTRDPEVRQTPNGQYVTTFGIATNREWVTRDNQRHTSSEYHEIVAWSHLAEICGKYLKKSKLVYIEGYLKTRSWDTPEGLKKFKTEIVIQDMIMLEKRQTNGSEEYIPEEAPIGTTSEGTTPEIEETTTPEAKPRSVKKKETARQPEPAAETATPQKIDIDKDLGL